MAIMIYGSLWNDNDWKHNIEPATEIHISLKKKKKVDEQSNKVPHIEISDLDTDSENGKDIEDENEALEHEEKRKV